jgi:CRISPR system Cascade subunit CasD
MSTFCFRLCGPMQSWGTQSRFLVRDTGLEPSKSGVVGLICAAMGKHRDDFEAIAKIAALRMAVRVDRPGTVRMDYHTVGGTRSVDDGYGVIRADGSGVGPVVSRRYYLADAEFLIGLEGARAQLEEIAVALSSPRWQVFLGRKSFVPSAPLILPAESPWNDGWTAEALEVALSSLPWLGLLSEMRPKPEKLRAVVDDQAGSEVRRDHPLSFAPRAFTIRHVRTLSVATSGVGA